MRPSLFLTPDVEGPTGVLIKLMTVVFRFHEHTAFKLFGRTQDPLHTHTPTPPPLLSHFPLPSRACAFL